MSEQSDTGATQGIGQHDSSNSSTAWPEDVSAAFAPLLRERIQTQPRLDDATGLNTLGTDPAQRLQAQLLANRGIAPGEMQRFLRGDWHADPALATLPVFQATVARLRAAIAARERVTVFGDYDCDGITSCSILVQALTAAGAVVNSRIPSRDDDGRGLNPEVVRELANQGTKLIITTDCGTANVAEVILARELGVDVIVTDHHPPHGESVDALEGMLVVNPLVAIADPFDPNLSGAGVAFRVAEALLRAVQGEAAEAAIRELLDLAAVGTIADIVPLSHRNWALAHAGLERLRQSPRPGLRALMESAGLRPAGLTDRDISFAIAPRLNAAPRLGKPELARDLLLAPDMEHARALAAEIEALNTQRQSDLTTMLAEAQTQAQRQVKAGARVLLVAGEDWSFGLIGLVAGRLSEEYERPAFALSHRAGEYRASGRGPDGVDLGQALAAKAPLFRRFGGHARAAGFTVTDATYPELRDYLNSYAWPAVASAVTETGGISETGDASGESAFSVDCELPLRRIGQEQYQAIHALEPFGPDFPEPVFLARNVKAMRCWQSGAEKRTLRLRLADERGREFVVLWSRAGSRFAEVQRALPRLTRCDIAYTLSAFPRRDGQVDLLTRLVAIAPTRTTNA